MAAPGNEALNLRGEAIVEIQQQYESNRRWWDAVTGPHVRSHFYDVPGFLAGRNTLPAYVVNEVGDVAGRSLLHLQCHFGLDTLSWARLGAQVTGVDFSGAAIAEAQRLTQQTGLEARFVQSNIFDLGAEFGHNYDIVFTSYGVLAWLHDLEPWARVIASALKPGGLFYIAEFHPVMDMLQDERPIAGDDDLVLRYPYFGEGQALEVGPGEGADYATSAQLHEPTYEWFHPLAEILGSLLQAGLSIEMFHEQDFCSYRARHGMVRGADRLWRLPANTNQVPLMFSLRARKL